MAGDAEGRFPCREPGSGVSGDALQLVVTASAPAAEIMRCDAQFLETIDERGTPLLHHYQWEFDSATYGYFVDPFQFLDKAAVTAKGVALARRPTGGGIMFHMTDLAFSLLVPAGHPVYSRDTMANYACVNKMVIVALRKFLGGDRQLQLLSGEPLPLDTACRYFCMAKPTRYDVLIDGAKVGGAAQRRTRYGFLHQGSLSVAAVPDELLSALLLPGTRVAEAMGQHGYTLLGPGWTPQQLDAARRELRDLLEVAFREGLSN